MSKPHGRLMHFAINVTTFGDPKQMWLCTLGYWLCEGVMIEITEGKVHHLPYMSVHEPEKCPKRP